MIVIVECAHEPVSTAELLRASLAQLKPCLVVRDVKPLASYLASGGSRAVHVFEAESPENVRNAFRSVGMAFERAWSAEAISLQP